MLKIWGRQNSNNLRKVLWRAEEAGVAYRSINAGGASGRVSGAEYRAKNPNGLCVTWPPAMRQAVFT